MKKFFFLASVLFSLSTNILQSQVTFNNGIEFGTSFSQLTFKNNAAFVPVAGRFISNQEAEKSNVGFLIGGTTQVNWGKRWVADAAVQVQTTGRKVSEYSAIFESTTSELPLATDNFNENQRFTKVSIPLSFGYKLPLGNNYLSFHLGIRANWLLTGRYSMTHQNYQANVTKLDQRMDAVDIFDKESFSISPKRNVNQIFAALSFQFGERFEISPRLNISPYNITYQMKNTAFCNGDCDKKMRGDDFQLILRYYVKK
ncbi:MAG: outer membrane beta-barrel protein [Saprospiraceae bacterium]|nr:outer membrane beta-barrel protein [Saprospiraceae bacterium]